LCGSPVLNNDRGAQKKIPPRLADADFVFSSGGLNQVFSDTARQAIAHTRATATGTHAVK